MADSRYRNIFLTDQPSSLSYTNPQRGGGSPRIPQSRDRQSHSGYLRRRFEQAWEAATAQASAVAVAERNGVYIEFTGEPRFDLKFESLEHRGQGIRLLNVRAVGDRDDAVTLATVYVPYYKRVHFLRLIDEYADPEKDSLKGNPRNQPLIDSISQIREATLASFWQQDEFESVPLEEPVRVEVWLLGDSEELPERFATVATEIGIEVVEGLLRFPERTVIPIEADRKQLTRLIASFDEITEFRLARQLATYYVELENADQADAIQELLSRCQFEDREGVSVCVLDSGVNNGHPLLQPVLSDRDRNAVLAGWPSTDEPKQPHGTLMAGTVAYGNLLTHLNSNRSIQILHRLESVRILPPYPNTNSKELWGYRVSQGASISEINAPDRKRVYCLAVTARETSAASALAAEMAAKIQVAYPRAWPETIRGLMIHSAEWTDEMKRQFLGVENPSKNQIADLLRTCGYGVPNLERASYCASNSLTLISEAEIQPYDKEEGRIVTRDMHLYDLPWPTEILLGMAERPVKMRVTLSYFIEPGPGEVGWGNRYRYPSHGLRFDVNGPREAEEEFVHRINVEARDKDEVIETTGATQYWTVGSNNRQLGSIHSDIWTGTGIDLSQSNLIAVYPTTGWWRTRDHLGCWDKRTRYSLIVSVETPEIDNDIYVAVATKIGIATPVVIPTGQ